MCGRFSLTQRLEILERIFKAKARTKLTLPRYNVAPTQSVVVITNDEPDVLQEIEWGFTVFPTDGSPPRKLVNAKAETLQERPAYRKAFASRRCLIVADGFYEWESIAGKRYAKYFRLRDHQAFAFAGLYDEEGDRRHAVIITTAANELVSPVHNRMPVILREPHRWLEPGDVSSLLSPYDPELMESFTVNPAVNSPEDDTELCIAPYEPPQLPLF
ncbi:MAG: SOS response-associated peptidase [Candidatus Eremiobacteraeota bacterium]|nr:SOS response-associated peptidase [Candidatus Eremiobacteraeota bacterium]